MNDRFDLDPLTSLVAQREFNEIRTDFVFCNDDDSVIQALLLGRDNDLVAFIACAFFSNVCAMLNSYY